MEKNNLTVVPSVRPSENPRENERTDNNKPFITANTVESLQEIKKHHIIPVFTKDNEPLVSHFRVH